MFPGSFKNLTKCKYFQHLYMNTIKPCPSRNLEKYLHKNALVCPKCLLK